METTQNRQVDKDQQAANHSLKKSLAIATVAVSLGIALGVDVVDVLAGEGPGSPPTRALSRQDKDLVSKQHKDVSQIQQSTRQSINQSKQIKIDSHLSQTIYGK